jgi:hypothetical protein
MKKRYKVTVTKKISSGLIQLAEIDYSIPLCLIDKKYPALKRGFPQHPLIITWEQFDRISSHYLRIKEFDYKRVVYKIDTDDESAKNIVLKHNFEDCYEKIDEMDYYRKWF